MTFITTYPSPRRTFAGPALSARAALAAFTDAASTLSCRWRNYRQLRALESLPEGVLKDIGWPGGSETR